MRFLVIHYLDPKRIYLVHFGIQHAVPYTADKWIPQM